MKLKPHKPIREKYNPRPSAKEKRFHLWLMNGPCAACGIEPCGVFHHLLSHIDGKRWDRDHEVGIGLCDPCHRELHAAGNELAWCESRGVDAIVLAWDNRALGKQKGLL